MSQPTPVRCAIYTRKSSEEGLDQSFNSLHAQREACEAYILSQKHEGWTALSNEYDDGGFSGGNIQRPGLKRLLADIDSRMIDTVVVYKVDRLTRSLTDFAKIVDAFDAKGISFVSVTQQFNTTTSMGRLTLNVLLSFAQFEREVTGERIRDKVAASKKKGMWMGGVLPLGYDVSDRKLIVNLAEAATVRLIFERYLVLKSVTTLAIELKARGVRSKRWIAATGRERGGEVLSRGTLYHLLSNPMYIGKTRHKSELHVGQHEALIGLETWTRTESMLKQHAVDRRSISNARSGRVLLGKLETASGSPYTPTHATKNNRRYHYYTLRQTEIGSSDVRSLPALPLEAQVASTLGSLLEDSIKLAEIFAGLPVHELRLVTTSAQHRAALLSGRTSDHAAKLVQSLVQRVTVSDHELIVALSKQALGAELQIDDRSQPAEDVIQLRVAIRIVRRGSEAHLVLSNGKLAHEKPIPALVHAVRQARTWAAWIETGQVASRRELAKKAGISQGYASRILRLAALSPELEDAILTGRHAPTLTVTKLIDKLPFDWTLQKLPS